MATYRKPGPFCVTKVKYPNAGIVSRAGTFLPGPLGLLQGNPLDGRTPAPTGRVSAATLRLPAHGPLTPPASPKYGPASPGPSSPPSPLHLAKELSFSAEGQKLLKSVEELHLKPYDDATGKPTTTWVQGATIGYGHLIGQFDWALYKDGIDAPAAESLFARDVFRHVAVIHATITARISQQQFDAMVILAFNIGPGPKGFGGSSVAKLVNDPKAKTDYPDLEAAWKAWNKSQGKVVQGLVNRRACEWNIYTQGIYKKW
jgi:lysozyme